MTPPNFKKPLEPVTVTEGDEAKFEVEFTGDPMPAVKWFRYSFPINTNDDIKIVTDNFKSTLAILRSCPDDTGIFSCIIENIAGASKSSTNLNVVEAGQEYVLQASTKTTRRLQEMSVSAGDNIRFDIQFSAGDKSQLQFFHDGRTINEDEEGVKILFDNDLATLLIENAAANHSGLYECLMKTDGGEARCQVKCQVVESRHGVADLGKVESRTEASSSQQQMMTSSASQQQQQVVTSSQQKQMVASSSSSQQVVTSSSSQQVMTSSVSQQQQLQQQVVTSSTQETPKQAWSVKKKENKDGFKIA